MMYGGLKVSLLIALSLFLSCRAEVVELTDATFEHQTQASTGMTTGSWFVMFKAEKCAHCAKLKPDFERLSEDPDVAENGIILASVDVPSNRETATRFNIKGFPVLLFFQRGKMYKFRGQRQYDVLKRFLLEGIQAMEGSEIPVPLSGVDMLLRELKQAGEDFYIVATGQAGTVGLVVGAMSLLFFGLIIVLIGMCFWPSKEEKTKGD